MCVCQSTSSISEHARVVSCTYICYTDHACIHTVEEGRRQSAYRCTSYLSVGTQETACIHTYMTSDSRGGGSMVHTSVVTIGRNSMAFWHPSTVLFTYVTCSGNPSCANHMPTSYLRSRANWARRDARAPRHFPAQSSNFNRARLRSNAQKSAEGQEVQLQGALCVVSAWVGALGGFWPVLRRR